MSTKTPGRCSTSISCITSCALVPSPSAWAATTSEWPTSPPSCSLEGSFPSSSSAAPTPSPPVTDSRPAKPSTIANGLSSWACRPTPSSWSQELPTPGRTSSSPAASWPIEESTLNRRYSPVVPYQQRGAYATCRRLWPSLRVICASAPHSFDGYVEAIGDPAFVINMIVGDTERVIEYPKLGHAIDQEVPSAVGDRGRPRRTLEGLEKNTCIRAIVSRPWGARGRQAAARRLTRPGRSTGYE